MFPRHGGGFQRCGRGEEDCHGRLAKPEIKIQALACCARCSQLCIDALPRLGLETVLCSETEDSEDTRDDA